MELCEGGEIGRRCRDGEVFNEVNGAIVLKQILEAI